MNFSTPRAPPNDPERRGNIWQQHEQLQAMYSQLMEQNSQLVTERSQYQHVSLTVMIEAATLSMHKQKLEPNVQLKSEFPSPHICDVSVAV